MSTHANEYIYMNTIPEKSSQEKHVICHCDVPRHHRELPPQLGGDSYLYLSSNNTDHFVEILSKPCRHTLTELPLKLVPNSVPTTKNKLM